VAKHFLDNFKIFVVALDVSIDSEVWYWVINVVSSVLFLVLILVTTGGRADWVRSHADVLFRLNEVGIPLSVFLLHVFGVLHGSFNIVV